MRTPTLRWTWMPLKKQGFFFFNDTATTEIYTLSLHDALPIYHTPRISRRAPGAPREPAWPAAAAPRSEEHTSELQSQSNLVCRLLLEKKNFISMELSLKALSMVLKNRAKNKAADRAHAAILAT